jgi:hypothetical protein
MRHHFRSICHRNSVTIPMPVYLSAGPPSSPGSVSSGASQALTTTVLLVMADAKPTIAGREVRAAKACTAWVLILIGSGVVSDRMAGPAMPSEGSPKAAGELVEVVATPASPAFPRAVPAHFWHVKSIFWHARTRRQVGHHLLSRARPIEGHGGGSCPL